MNAQGDGSLALAIGKRVGRSYARRSYWPAQYADDFESDAVHGALEGHRTFDPSRGSYDDWVAAHARHRVIDGVRQRLGRNGGRQPFVNALSLDEPLCPDSVRLRDVLPAPEDPTAQQQEDAEVIGQVLGYLLPHHAALLRAIYWNGETQDSIANRLQVTPARVSQLHAEAIKGARRLWEQLTTGRRPHLPPRRYQGGIEQRAEIILPTQRTSPENL